METTTRRTTRLESYESTTPETRTTKETTITGITEKETEDGTHQTLPSDHESSKDHSHEDIRGILDNYHPGRTPFTMRILESRIPRALEKPHKLETHDGTTDPDGLPEHIDIILDYYQAHKMQTLRAHPQWYRHNLVQRTRRQFHRLRERTTMVSLSNIIRGEKNP
jgi:hypothetical protein